MSRVTELMTLSIRWKVALAILFALVCGFIIAGLLAARSLAEQELMQSEGALEVSTNLIAFDLRPLVVESSPLAMPRLQTIVRELGHRAHARVTLVDASGRVLADSAVRDEDVAGIENHRTRPEIVQAIATGSGTDLRASHTTGERTLYRAIRLEGPGTSKALYLRLGLPMTALDQELATLKRNLSLAFGSAFLIAVALSIWLARSLTKPLSDMATAAQQLAGGNLAVHVETSTRDEVGLLAHTLNHMTEELRSKIEELSEDRSQLLAMLTSMVEGVMVLDSKGRILQVNPAWERMFGVTRAEARGRHSSDVFAHAKLNALVTGVLAARAGQEAEIVLANGRCLNVEASVAGGEQDNEACAVLVFHDITELRRLEHIRKDFVANVSHELRTPLTSIKGYVEALLDGGKDDPETSVRFLDIILKQSDRLNLILEDLLQLSKIESGQVQFKEEPLQIGSVVDRTIAMIKPLADKKQHRLQAQVDADLPLINGDQERLVQVLANLLDNAIKYTPEGGQITVSARRIPASARPTPDEPRAGVELTVTDSGIGIPEKDRPRVFERFYRVDKARS
ncbi:MAG TPA: histidine kinase dimerization/phospho-acceptor domain-containing protein, partial [Nitrospira sp.]|nr:histidine kinase dimerization/phospho-acceptor domain-containing protein [Nitrospira sp.]